MKNNIINFTIILIALSLSSCKKEVEKEYSLSGYIYANCSVPQPNTPIEIVIPLTYDPFSGESGGTLATTTTDSAGHFSVRYKSKNASAVTIRTAAGFGTYDIISRVPSNNINNLIAYISPTTNIEIDLNVLKQSNPGDTLFIQRMYDPYIAFACPITNKKIIASNIKLDELNFSDNSLKSTMSFRWYFKSSPDVYKTQKLIIDKFCSDTVKAVIDIN